MTEPATVPPGPVPDRPGEAEAAEAVARFWHSRPYAIEGCFVCRGLTKELIAAAYDHIAEAMRAEEREKVLGTFRALIADEKALGDESFFYASLDGVADFVTEAAARLARRSTP